MPITFVSFQDISEKIVGFFFFMEKCVGTIPCCICLHNRNNNGCEFYTVLQQAQVISMSDKKYLFLDL